MLLTMLEKSKLAMKQEWFGRIEISLTRERMFNRTLISNRKLQKRKKKFSKIVILRFLMI